MNDLTPDPIARRWLTLSGAALLVLAAAVLLGRFTGQIWLVTITPKGSPMAFPTVIGFLLAGGAFVAQGLGRTFVGRTLAILLLGFGGGTLLLYSVAEPLGIQAFIYNAANPVLSKGVRFDGTMSPNVASGFALLGMGVLLLSARRIRPWTITPCVALLLTLSCLAMISYLTGLRFAAAWWRYAAMAIHTAAGFVVAAAALLVWMIRRMSTAEKAFVRILPFAVVASTSVLVLGAVVFVSNEQRLEATGWMNHTLEVDAAIDRFIASVARLESATRAFALTGDERYLERIAIHRNSISTAAEALIALTTDHPPQHERALALLPLIERKLAVNDAQVQARRERGAAAAAAVLQAEPPELMAGLKAATDGMEAVEKEVMAGRRSDTAINEARLQWVLLAGVLLTAGFVSAAFTLIYRTQCRLRDANEQLEQRVRERTAELESSATEVRRSEARWRFLADTMPQLVWTAGENGAIDSVNEGYKRYLGKTSEAEAIAALATVLHPDDYNATSVEWTAMRTEGRPAGGELRLRRHDGEYRWHLWRAHPERDAAGRIVRWVGTSTDIHDKKISEEQLERRVAERTAELVTSEERFRQAFYFAGTGMAIVALDGRWLRVNRSICEIVGYSEVELLQKTFQDITHPEDLAADLAHVRELIEGVRRFYQMEKRYLHRDGHVVWVRLTVSLVHDAQQRPVHFVSQVEDITEHKNLERSLAAARDQALEASRLKSEFLATMSHEIRTPMNGVIGMTALLRDTPLTPTQAEYVRTIESSGESLLTIINDILDYSKIEAGRIDLEIAPFNLRQCVEEAFDLFAGRARSKRITLEHVITSDTPDYVAGDATRLRQILVNLLGNAIKFTETGKITITLDAERLEAGAKRQRLHFAITDTGIGIAPEGMERLFKSFSQVDASTTRRFGGTGLGLAISKRLAVLMGGTMWAESEPGKGSTFHFTVVVETHAAPAPSASAAAAPADDIQLGRRCPLKLLIAEDNPVNQRVASLLLQRLGYRANAVANGLEALSAMDMADYDAILMDVEMPELDGCEATRRIRASRRSRTRPWIIALTAGAMQDDRDRAFAAGMNDFLTKPVRTESLSLALVRAHAGLNGKGDAMSASSGEADSAKT